MDQLYKTVSTYKKVQIKHYLTTITLNKILKPRKIKG